MQISSFAGDVTDLGGNALSQVATNATGNAVAVWQNTPLAGNILLNRVFSVEAAVYSILSGSWSSTFTIGNGFTPQVAIDSSGNAIAVWVNGPQSDLSWALQSSYYNVTTGLWSSPVNIPTINARQNKALYTPQIVMTSTGGAIVVWSDGFNDQIYGATFTGGSSTLTWSAPGQISIGSGVLPQISIDTTTDVATVVWQTTIQSTAKIEIESSFVSAL